MAELVHKGKITARSLWKEVYPEFKDDPRYTNLLGVPDSTPFDLFCDLLDDLDEKLYQDKRIVYDILKVKIEGKKKKKGGYFYIISKGRRELIGLSSNPKNNRNLISKYLLKHPMMSIKLYLTVEMILWNEPIHPM